MHRKYSIDRNKKIGLGLKRAYAEGRLKSWSKGKTKATCESLQKTSGAMKAYMQNLLSDPEFGETRRNEFRQNAAVMRSKLTPESHRKQAETLRNTILNSPELMAKFAKMCDKYYDTRIECATKRLLDKLRIDYAFQKYIKGVGYVDFYVPVSNIAIFVDVCYWHGCLGCFSLDKLPKARHYVGRDKAITERCINMGYSVLRIWEHEFNHIEMVEAKIARCIGFIMLKEAA